MSTRPVLLAMVVALGGCRCGDGGPGTAGSAREAMQTLVQCAFNDVPVDATADHVEAAIRRALHTERERFAGRAGRCEESLTVGEATPPCLARVRREWATMLPVAESPTPDPIAVDRAVRHVGDAWTEARARCP